MSGIDGLDGSDLKVFWSCTGALMKPPTAAETEHNSELLRKWHEGQGEMAEYMDEAGCGVIVFTVRQKTIAIMCIPNLLEYPDFSASLQTTVTTKKFPGSTYLFEVNLGSDGSVKQRKNGDPALTAEQELWLQRLFHIQKQVAHERRIPLSSS